MKKNNPLQFDLKSSDYSKYKVLVIQTKWNYEVIQPMVDDCLTELKDKKIDPEIVSVPGAYEIPFIANKKANYFDLIITMGAIIKGETPHFDIIAQTISDSIMHIGLSKETPIIFGVFVLKAIKINSSEIDQEIEKFSKVKLSEITEIEISILRLAIHELKENLLDKAIVINEAIRLAKKFGQDSSHKFVNAVLDKISS